MTWNAEGTLFFVTTGNGTIEVLKFPELKSVRSITGHTAGIYCIELDPVKK